MCHPTVTTIRQCWSSRSQENIPETLGAQRTAELQNMKIIFTATMDLDELGVFDMICGLLLYVIQETLGQNNYSPMFV